MQSVINIVFRGLLVFHLIGGGNTGQPAMMEVGMLPEKDHYARILIKKDGNRVNTKCLFPRIPNISDDCVFDEAPSAQQVYQIKIDDPVSLGATILKNNAHLKIDRSKPDVDEEDFRWILDIENSDEFPYGNLHGKLDFSELKFVIRIPAGEFYTAALSETSLNRVSNLSSTPKEFGYIAGIIGCRIRVKSGGAGLYGTIKNSAGQYEVDLTKQIATFSSSPRYSYEIANSPSDTYTTPEDHFHYYYDLFEAPPNEMFSFKSSDRTKKGPNPALCGAIYLSQSSDSLTQTAPAPNRPVQQNRRKKKKTDKSHAGKRH